MTPETERLVRHSWLELTPLRARTAALFYERLFDISPSARALFVRAPMHVQQEKLLRTLDFLVQTLDYPPRIIEELQALARRHEGYGVIVEQYEPVGDALLWALAQGLGDRFTPEVSRAWTDLYTFIAGVMIREVQPKPVG
jgi:hemoglobin-like flavoprotein